MTSSKRPASHGKPVSLLMLQSREVGAAEFKARCLEIVEEVDRLGMEVVITRHRKPVARIVPMRASVGEFCGSLKSMIVGAGDLVSPVDVAWEGDESHFA